MREEFLVERTTYRKINKGTNGCEDPEFIRVPVKKWRILKNSDTCWAGKKGSITGTGGKYTFGTIWLIRGTTIAIDPVEQ